MSPSTRTDASERAFALLLLLLSAPLIAMLALAIRIVAGGPMFHRGTRLGRDKRPFQMLKLRTLRVGAERITRGELLSHRHDLTIPGGRFLRETRLDELPQLWNIVCGEMSFVGPRPERPEVLETKCVGIPGYEQRFAVRPGLIGISQLFTPHGTPKRYRTLLDNAVIRRHATPRRQIVLFTMWVVVCEVSRRAARQLALLSARVLGRFREKRRQNRVVPHGASLHLGRADSASGARVLDMNEEAILVECPPLEPALGETTEFMLQIPLPGRNRPARRTARCKGHVSEIREGAAGVLLVIRYETCTPRSEYMVHQYFLRDSLAVRRRAWSGPSPARPRVVPQPSAPAPKPVLAGRRAGRVYH
jgi:lipopolysaccharide/colanic/teichoic acid biosynthesis glycosyltransferase